MANFMYTMLRAKLDISFVVGIVIRDISSIYDHIITYLKSINQLLI